MENIYKRLYLGSHRDATICLHDPSFFVVTVAVDSPVQGHFFYPMTDPGEDKQDPILFKAATDLICNILNTQDKNILVHCVAGVNRSPAIVIAVLMRETGCSLTEAYNLVKTQRRHINPCNQQLVNALNCDSAAPLPMGYPIDRKDFLPNYRNEHERIVNDLYREVLRREADPDGLNHYSTLLASNRHSVEQIRQHLLNSNEYKKKFLK